MALETCEAWLGANQAWLAELKLARMHKNGFYFEMIEEGTHGEESFKAYLAIGKIFHDYINDTSVSTENKIKAVILSEEHDHALHNAAVLWLEEEEEETRGVKRNFKRIDDHDKIFPLLTEFAKQPEPRKSADVVSLAHEPSGSTKGDFSNVAGAKQSEPSKYEHTLKALWIDQIIKKSPHINNKRKSAAIQYLSKHSALGKVILRRKTQFHDHEQIRVHPGFWGLFLTGSRSTADKGPYEIEHDETAWIQYLKAQNLHDGSNDYRFYESVPRVFADVNQVKPGFYMHRSKAHGRDDFLVLVEGDTIAKRTYMVYCTKGIGGDFDLVPQTTAGNLHRAFKNTWDVGDMYPFSYADDAGSWSTLGFCLVYGDVGGRRETEIATVDYHNFAGMYDHVKLLAANSATYNSIINGFVEPYVCIQLSCLQHYREMMLPPVLEAIANGSISWPTQVSTGAPCETSLRVYKRPGDEQNYDYDAPDLERKEWNRCFRDLTLSQEVQDMIDSDLRSFDADWDVQYPEYYLSVLVPGTNKPYDEQALQTLASIKSGESERKQKASELFKHEALTLCFKLAVTFFGSYIAFVHKGWGSDTSTGSFSGRNFNSGPRDANQWGPLLRRMEEGAPLASAALIDTRDFMVTVIGDLAPCAGLVKKAWFPSLDIKGSNYLHISLLNSLKSVVLAGENKLKGLGTSDASSDETAFTRQAQQLIIAGMLEEGDRLNATKATSGFCDMFMDLLQPLRALK